MFNMKRKRLFYLLLSTVIFITALSVVNADIISPINSYYPVSDNQPINHPIEINGGGSLEISTGGTVNITADITVYSGGNLTIDGGTLTTDHLITINSGGTFTIKTGSTLNTSNSIVVDGGTMTIEPGIAITFASTRQLIVQNNGTLSIGDSSGATVVLEGNGWNGVNNNGSNLTINNTQIKGALYGIFQEGNAETLINDSIVQDCSTGIDAKSGSLEITNNEFLQNHDAIFLRGLTTLVPIRGNNFGNDANSDYKINGNTSSSIKLEGTNNVDIRFNNFYDKNATTISLGVGMGTDHSGVKIAFNNFFHQRDTYDQDTFFYIVGNIQNAAVSVPVYSCYWENNGDAYPTLSDIFNLSEPIAAPTPSNVIVVDPRPSEITDFPTSDTSRPILVEVNPTIATYSSTPPTWINLSVILSDVGFGINPDSVVIKLIKNSVSKTEYTATVNKNYNYTSRGYVFSAKVNVADDGVGTTYYWDISAADYNNNSLLPGAGNNYTLELADLSEVNAPSDWDTKGVYYLISLPLTPNQNDHKDALGLTQPDTKLARYQNGSSSYIYYGEEGFANQPFKPGEGFWIKFGVAEDLTPGRTIEGVTLNQNDFQDQIPYSTALLTPGWYLIGNPFSHIAELSLANMSFTYDAGDTTERWVGAVADGVVSFGLWGYNTVSGNYTFERDKLEIWKGYWIRVKKDCIINYYLNPYNGTGVTSLSWDMQLTTTQGSISDSANYIGLMSAAKAEVDVFDSEKPPAMSSGIKSFLQPTGTVREFGVDLRSSNAAKEKWRYVVTGLSPGEARISWNGLGDVPQNYQLILKDNISGSEIDLRKNTAYTFTVTTETRREFDIVMQDVLTAAIQFSVISLEHNPFSPARGQSVQINYHLSAAATLDVKVYDWVGNLVYVYQPINAIGDSNITWNGRNNRGQLVANGVYFCKITARNNSDNGSQIIKLAVIN